MYLCNICQQKFSPAAQFYCHLVSNNFFLIQRKYYTKKGSLQKKIWSLLQNLKKNTRRRGQGQKLTMSILKVYLYTKQYYELSIRYITSNVAICVHNYRV